METVNKICQQIYRQGPGIVATQSDLRDAQLEGASRYHVRTAVAFLRAYDDAKAKYRTVAAEINIEEMRKHLISADNWYKARSFVRAEGDL